MAKKTKSVWLVKIHDHRQDDEIVVCETREVAETIFYQAVYDTYFFPNEPGNTFDAVDKAVKEGYWESGDDNVSIVEEPIVSEV